MDCTKRVNAQLRSRIDKDGRLEIDFERSEVAELAHDEVLIEVEAAPINPSDMPVLFGTGAMPELKVSGSGLDRRTTAQIPSAVLPGLSGRLDQAVLTGLEGCGTVVEAGASDAAQALLGRRVSTSGPGMYAKFRVAKSEDCVVLPVDVTPVEGASAFINPLTALGMVETAKAEGHRAMIFTAAASNLGGMVQRLCEQEGIGFVGVVRGDAQVEKLRARGVSHICNLTSPNFSNQLNAAITATGAMLAFDAIAGGEIVNEILRCMEVAAVRDMAAFSRYGSPRHKQLYLYGTLDASPTLLKRNFGMSFGIGGWLLFHYLSKISTEQRRALSQKVADGLKTTFVTDYGAAISLEDALDPEIIAQYMLRGTGGKYLIMPKGPAQL